MGEGDPESTSKIGNVASEEEPERPEEASKEAPSSEDPTKASPSDSPESSDTLTPSPRETRSRKRRASQSEEPSGAGQPKRRPTTKATRGKGRKIKTKTNMSGPGVDTLAAAAELKEEDLKHLSMPAFFCLMDKRLGLMDKKTKEGFQAGFGQIEQQFSQVEKQWKISEHRHEVTEAKVTELDERITAIEKRAVEEVPTAGPSGGGLSRLAMRNAASEEVCFRQLIIGPADVDEKGVAAVEQLVQEVLYDVMGFPKQDPFRVNVESVSVTKKSKNQISTDMYAKITFVDANVRKQVLLAQGKLSQTKRNVDVRIVVPHSMKRMERSMDKILYYLRTITKGTAGKKCQTNTDVDQERGVVGMYRWKFDGQPPGRWAYVEPFENMLRPELQQFEQFVGKTLPHMQEEWKRTIQSGFDPVSGRIQ